MTGLPRRDPPALPHSASGRIVVLLLPRERTVEVTGGDIRIGGVLVTRAGGWLTLHAVETPFPDVLRTVEIRVAAEAIGEDSVGIVVDRVRLADVEWRDVNAFLAATKDVWTPVLVQAAARAIRLATKSGVHTRGGS